MLNRPVGVSSICLLLVSLACGVVGALEWVAPVRLTQAGQLVGAASLLASAALVAWLRWHQPRGGFAWAVALFAAFACGVDTLGLQTILVLAAAVASAIILASEIRHGAKRAATPVFALIMAAAAVALVISLPVGYVRAGDVVTGGAAQAPGRTLEARWSLHDWGAMGSPRLDVLVVLRGLPLIGRLVWSRPADTAEELTDSPVRWMAGDVLRVGTVDLRVR